MNPSPSKNLLNAKSAMVKDQPIDKVITKGTDGSNTLGYVLAYLFIIVGFIILIKILMDLYEVWIKPFFPKNKETDSKAKKTNNKKQNEDDISSITESAKEQPKRIEKVELPQNIIGTEKEIDLEYDDKYKPQNLNDILDECSYYATDTKQVQVFREGSSTPSTSVKKETKIYPKISFYPDKKGSPKTSILFDVSLATHKKNLSFNKVPPENMQLFGELLYKAGVISNPELFFEKTNRAEVYKVNVATEELKLKKNIEALLHRNQLYQNPINKTDSFKYPSIIKMPNGDLKISLKDIPLTMDKIARIIPQLELTFKDHYDLTSLKLIDPDTYRLTKVIPTKRFLSKLTEVKEKDGKVEIVTTKSQTVLDRFDDFKKWLDSEKEKYEKTFIPHTLIGEPLVARDFLKDTQFITVPLLTNPHSLTSGGSGSGKTKTCVSVLVYQAYVNGATILYHDNKNAVETELLARYTSPYAPSIFLEETKTTSQFHTLYCQIQLAYNEILNRAKKCSEIGATDYIDYNKKMKKNIFRPFILFIDEWGTKASALFEEGDLKSPKAGSPHAMLMHIAKAGRSYGVCIMLATQDVKDVEIPNVLKGQLSVRMYHKMNNITDMNYLGLPSNTPMGSLPPGEFILKCAMDELEFLRTGGILMADSGEGLTQLLQKLGFEDRKQNRKQIEYDFNEVFITGVDDKGSERDIVSLCRLIKKYTLASNFESLLYIDKGIADDSIFHIAKSNNPNFSGYLVFGLLNTSFHKVKHIVENYKTFEEKYGNDKVKFIYIVDAKKIPKELEKEINNLYVNPEESDLMPNTIIKGKGEIDYLLSLCVEDTETFTVNVDTNNNSNEFIDGKIEIKDQNVETKLIKNIKKEFKELDEYLENLQKTLEENAEKERELNEINSINAILKKPSIVLDDDMCALIIKKLQEDKINVEISPNHQEQIRAYAIKTKNTQKSNENKNESYSSPNQSNNENNQDEKKEKPIRRFERPVRTNQDKTEKEEIQNTNLDDTDIEDEIERRLKEIENEANEEENNENKNNDSQKDLPPTSDDEIDTEGEKENKDLKRRIFTREQKQEIINEGKENNLSNNQLEKKYNLSKGIIGKWKKELEIE